jgi:hypothetical protein
MGPGTMEVRVHADRVVEKGNSLRFQTLLFYGWDCNFTNSVQLNPSPGDDSFLDEQDVLLHLV